jgi:2-polyprenyl-3-methyl-5-hydroxy-6-metoxy-1,4-benzoquinol methylase
MAQELAVSEQRYQFGKNWAEFIDADFSPQRVDQAQEHLLRFLHRSDLRGQVFLDIGCGSGLHALAAWRAGAERVIAFDYDADSVATTRKLWHGVGAPANWSISQGSVLDPAFLDQLPRADIVYSWGVLHHTGAMWDAVRGAASMLKPDGVLYIALYCSDVHVNPSAEYWLRTKQTYNAAGSLRKRWMEWRHAWRATIRPSLKKFQNPFRQIFRARSRGMSYWTDVRDWLGGWPMEFAGIAETKQFCSQQLDLELLHMDAGEANTEYLFQRRGARNWWNAVRSQRILVPLTRPFERVAGHCWRTRLDGRFASGCDCCTHPRRSELLLFEDGIPVGFSHQSHQFIQDHGTGRYAHWNDYLFFAATDNSDPNTNGRTYAVCWDAPGVQ